MVITLWIEGAWTVLRETHLRATWLIEQGLWASPPDFLCTSQSEGACHLGRVELSSVPMHLPLQAYQPLPQEWDPDFLDEPSRFTLFGAWFATLCLLGAPSAGPSSMYANLWNNSFLKVIFTLLGMFALKKHTWKLFLYMSDTNHIYITLFLPFALWIRTFSVLKYLEEI